MKAASRASPSSSWPMRARPCPSPRCLPLHLPLPLPRSPTRHLDSTNRENRWVARHHLHLCRCTFFSNRYYSHTYLTYVHALYLEHTHPSLSLFLSLSLSLSCITRVAPHCVNTLVILHAAHSQYNVSSLSLYSARRTSTSSRTRTTIVSARRSEPSRVIHARELAISRELAVRAASLSKRRSSARGSAPRCFISG